MVGGELRRCYLGTRDVTELTVRSERRIRVRRRTPSDLGKEPWKSPRSTGGSSLRQSGPSDFRLPIMRVWDLGSRIQQPGVQSVELWPLRWACSLALRVHCTVEARAPVHLVFAVLDRLQQRLNNYS